MAIACPVSEVSACGSIVPRSVSKVTVFTGDRIAIIIFYNNIDL